MSECDRSLLAQMLYQSTAEITIDYVKSLLEERVKRSDFIAFLIEFFSKFALTNNLWILRKIKHYCDDIESTKQNDTKQLLKYYYEVLNIINTIPKQRYVFCDETDRKSISIADMNTVSFDVNYSVVEDELNSMAKLLKSDVYKLLIVFYSCLTKSNNLPREENVRKCFLILRYLLTLPTKSFLKAQGSKLDIIDIVFLVFMIFSGSSICSHTIRQYIHFAKDVVYYRATKQKKWCRKNILFYLVYCIVFDEVIDIAVDCKEYTEYNNNEDTVTDKIQGGMEQHGVNESSNKNDGTMDVNEKCKYLFFYSEYDEPMVLQLKFEKERNTLQRTYRPSFKEIDVAWTLNHEKEFIVVSKQGTQGTQLRSKD
jgi:hypothetical protein